MLSPYTFVTSFCEHQPLTNQNLLTHLHTPTHIHSPLLYIHTHRIYRFHVLIRIQNTHKTIGCIKKALFLAAWTTPVSKYCFLFRGRHIYTYRTLFIHWIFSNTYVLIRTIKKMLLVLFLDALVYRLEFGVKRGTAHSRSIPPLPPMYPWRARWGYMLCACRKYIYSPSSFLSSCWIYIYVRSVGFTLNMCTLTEWA